MTNQTKNLDEIVILHDTLSTLDLINNSGQYARLEDVGFDIRFNLFEKIKDYLKGGVEEGYEIKFNKSIENRIKRVIAGHADLDGFVLKNLSLSTFIRGIFVHGYPIQIKQEESK